jgi:hypothetical protein
MSNERDQLHGSEDRALPMPGVTDSVLLAENRKKSSFFVGYHVCIMQTEVTAEQLEKRDSIRDAFQIGRTSYLSLGQRGVSGSLATLASRTIFPLPSTTHTLLSSSETSIAA